MYCRNCGAQLDDRAVYCPHCGTPTGVPYPNAQGQAYAPPPNQAAPLTESTAGWTVLGFFLPLVGLILYLVWSSDQPLRAKAAGKGALISVIVSVALGLLYVILAVVLIAVLVPPALYSLWLLALL